MKTGGIAAAAETGNNLLKAVQLSGSATMCNHNIHSNPALSASGNSGAGTVVRVGLAVEQAIQLTRLLGIAVKYIQSNHKFLS